MISRGLRASESFVFSSLLLCRLCSGVVLDHVFLANTVNLKDLPMGHLLPGAYVDPEVGIAVLLFRPVMAVPTLSATARRLHDVGRSGWWSCLWVFPIPVVGWFWLIPWLLQTSQPE